LFRLMQAWLVGQVRYVLKMLIADPVVTLSELISRFDVDPNDAVLKMDYEGCEFAIILNDYERARLIGS